MHSKKVKFTNLRGVKLAGRLELPLDKEPANYAIFAHCFTCGKDLKAIHNISLALIQQGIAVLRFDFTGLGQSEGDFSESHFSSNVEDLQAAYEFLSDYYQAPSLLIGHSLGGTAVLMAASLLPLVKAVVTIGSPCHPQHVLKLLKDDIDQIEEDGEATIQLAGRQFLISKRFIEDMGSHRMQDSIKKLRGRSLLILHSPQDEIVNVDNARLIYEEASHPKSYVSLDGADHLLSRKEDSLYVGQLIGSWASRYLPQQRKQKVQTDEAVLAQLNEGPFLTRILAGQHHLVADEPEDIGGENLGPTPYELVAAGLGACTAMTIKMYVNRKGWPLDEVNVHLSYDGKYKEDCESCEEKESKIGRFIRKIELKGSLDKKQKERILAIANKCPVHRTLVQGADVETDLIESDEQAAS